MEYKIIAANIKAISSPITVKFNENSRDFANGDEMAEFVFSENYLVSNIYVSEGRIIVELKVNDLINNTNWTEKEQLSFF